MLIQSLSIKDDLEEAIDLATELINMIGVDIVNQLQSLINVHLKTPKSGVGSYLKRRSKKQSGSGFGSVFHTTGKDGKPLIVEVI